MIFLPCFALLRTYGFSEAGGGENEKTDEKFKVVPPSGL